MCYAFIIDIGGKSTHSIYKRWRRPQSFVKQSIEEELVELWEELSLIFFTMSLRNIQTIAIFCASIFIMVLTENSTLLRHARSIRAPLTLTMTGTTVRNCHANICFITGTASNDCSMRFLSAAEQRAVVYGSPMARFPMTVTLTGCEFDHSNINVCILDGKGSNYCEMGSPWLLDSPNGNGVSGKLPPGITITGTSFTRSFINLYIREGGDIYQCTISGPSHHSCYVRSSSSSSNEVPQYAEQRGPITVTITGGSFNNENVNLCIYTGYSAYTCTITGNSYSACQSNSFCHLH